MIRQIQLIIVLVFLFLSPAPDYKAISLQDGGTNSISITVAGNPLLSPIIDFVAHSDNMLEVSVSSSLEVMNLDPNIKLDVRGGEITDRV